MKNTTPPDGLDGKGLLDWYCWKGDVISDRLSDLFMIIIDQEDNPAKAESEFEKVVANSLEYQGYALHYHTEQACKAVIKAFKPVVDKIIDMMHCFTY